MKRIYGYLTVVSFSLSLIVGITLPAKAEQAPVVIQLFYRLFKADQLLVITEPSCHWCRELHPHLEQLKKEGYNVRTYTKRQWNRAKKPSGLPKSLSTGQYGVPVVLYAQANEVIRSHYGGKDANYIKRYLAKN